MFRLAVSGYRKFHDYAFLAERLDSLLAARLPDVVILHGAAAGADSLAERYAEERGFTSVPIPAQWSKYGKSAGMIRNKLLIFEADAVVAFRAPQSVGTFNATDLAIEYGKPMVIYDVELDADGMVLEHKSYRFEGHRDPNCGDFKRRVREIGYERGPSVIQ